MARKLTIATATAVATLALTQLLTPLHTHTQNRRDAHYGERHGSTEQRAKTENQCTFKHCARRCLEGPRTQTLQLDFADTSSAQLVPN